MVTQGPLLCVALTNAWLPKFIGDTTSQGFVSSFPTSG